MACEIVDDDVVGVSAEYEIARKAHHKQGQKANDDRLEGDVSPSLLRLVGSGDALEGRQNAVRASQREHNAAKLFCCSCRDEIMYLILLL